jgi:hypothetical protein
MELHQFSDLKQRKQDRPVITVREQPADAGTPYRRITVVKETPGRPQEVQTFSERDVAGRLTPGARRVLEGRLHSWSVMGSLLKLSDQALVALAHSLPNAGGTSGPPNPNQPPPQDVSQPVKRAPSQKWRTYQEAYDATALDRTAKIQALADGGFDMSAIDDSVSDALLNEMLKFVYGTDLDGDAAGFDDRRAKPSEYDRFGDGGDEDGDAPAT